MAGQQQLRGEVGPQGGVRLGGGQRRPAPGQGGIHRPGLGVGDRVPAEPGCAPVPVGGCGVAAAAAGEQGAHRGEGVAADPAGPDQVPQRGLGGLVGDLSGELAEEERPPGLPGVAEYIEDRPVRVGEVELGRRAQRQRCGLGQVEGHPAVASGECSGTRPEDLPGGQQFVEHPGLVVAHPGRQDQRLDG